MKQKTNYTDLIIHYLSEDLSEPEKSQVEDLIQNDPDAKKEYLLQVDIQKAFSETEVNEFREKMAGIIAEENNNKGVYHLIFRSPVLKSFLMAASVTIIAGMLWIFMFKKPDPDRLFINYYTPYEANYAVRSQNADLGVTLSKAFKSFDSKDFKQATVLFDQVLQMDPGNFTAYFYNGISDIEVMQYLKATENFRKIVDHNDNMFVDKAEWYMGLCYLKLHELVKAKEVFEHIASTDSFYKKDAEKLVRKLR